MCAVFFVNKNFDYVLTEKICNFAKLIFERERTDKTALSQQLQRQGSH